MANALRTSVIALQDKLYQYEQRNGILLGADQDQADGRIAKIRENEFYRRHFVELFLKFKEVETIPREQSVFPDTFFATAQIEYQKAKGAKENAASGTIWQWARRSQDAEFLRNKYHLTKDQVGELKEGNTVSKDILGNVVVSIDVLLEADIAITAKDYGKVFSEQSVDFNILTNLVMSRKFMAQVTPASFTKGLVNIIGSGIPLIPVIKLFREHLGQGWSSTISFSVLCQESNLKKLRSNEPGTQLLLEQENTIVKEIQVYLGSATLTQTEEFYRASPFVFVEIARSVTTFIDFVKSKSAVVNQDIKSIFHKNLSDFQIEINLISLQDLKIPVLDDANQSDDSKIALLSEIHPRAFNRLLFFDDLAVKTIVKQYLDNVENTEKLLRSLSGDSIVGVFQFIEKYNIKIQFKDSIKDKTKILRLVLKKLSEALNGKAAFKYFGQLVHAYKEVLYERGIKANLNEALSNFLGKGVLEDSVFNFISDTGAVLPSTHTRFEERFSLNTDVNHYPVSVSYDVSKLTPVKPEISSSDNKPNIEFIPLPKSDIISESWWWGNEKLITSEVTLGIVCLVIPALVIGPQGGAYVTVARYAQAKCIFGLKVGLGTIGISEVGRLAYNKFWSEQEQENAQKAELKTICPDTGYCLLPEGSTEGPIKCIVGEMECPVMEG